MNYWIFTYQQHCKEKDSPYEWSWQCQNKLRISEEYQSGSMSCDRVDVGVLEMGHVSKDWKYEHSSSQAGASIDNTGYQCIPKMYLFCFKSQVWSCNIVFLCLWNLCVGREKKKTISYILWNDSMCCKNNDLKVMVSYANLQITLQLKNK